MCVWTFSSPFPSSTAVPPYIYTLYTVSVCLSVLVCLSTSERSKFLFFGLSHRDHEPLQQTCSCSLSQLVYFSHHSLCVCVNICKRVCACARALVFADVCTHGRLTRSGPRVCLFVVRAFHCCQSLHTQACLLTSQQCCKHF